MRSIVAILVAVAVACVVAGTDLGRRIELASVDLRFHARPVEPADATRTIAVLEVDDSTDARVERRWPYSRALHARALDALAAARVRAVVLDIQFLDPSEDPAADDELVAALARMHRAGIPVVLASASDPAHGGVPVPLSGIDRVRGDALGTRFERSGALLGRTDTDVDLDGVVRHAPPLHAGSTAPSLALATVRATDPDGAVGQTADERLLSWSTPRARIMNRNYADALTGDASALASLAGRIVFVGATSAVLHDQVRTPLDGRLPGVYLHAQSYLDLVSGDGVSTSPAWFGVGVAAVFALVLALLATGPLRRRVAAWTTIALVLAGGWIALAWWCFRFQALDVPVAAPVLGTLAALLVLVVGMARAAIRERRYVATVFSRYLAPNVVRELLARHELDVRPGGITTDVTVLFSDVRGFTALSARTPADELVAQLNEYFEEMVAAVDAQQGTVDKFIGDGMMAFFGAPAAQPDHATRAVRAAADMVRRLESVNERRSQRGLDALAIGIGVATGPVVVGNIGSTRRLEYTAIGDAVNLAARLEGASTQLGFPVVLAASTMHEVDDRLVRVSGTVDVRGFDEPVIVGTVR